MIVEF